MMRRVSTITDFAALRAGGEGFIYNDYTGKGSYWRHNVLHQAHCWHLARADLKRPKFFAESLDDAKAWLRQHRGHENEGWRRCEACSP
jgi:hypothetical protein